MKATELRIGNWYQVMTIGGYWHNRTMTVENLQSIDGCSIDVAKPIPLTEEWLERFGFEYSDLNGEGLSPSGSTKTKKMSDKEKIKKLIKLANAIINPASEILPETYDNELSNYWDFITTLNQTKEDESNTTTTVDFKTCRQARRA